MVSDLQTNPLIDLEYGIVTLDPKMMGLDACWKHLGKRGNRDASLLIISESLFRQRGDSSMGQLANSFQIGPHCVPSAPIIVERLGMSVQTL